MNAITAAPGGDLDDNPDWAVAPAPCLRWVATFLVTLSYGGPAEGGWFYDSGELVTDPALYARLGALPAAFLGDAEAEAHAARMSEGIAALNEGRPPKHSVLSEGVYEVHVLEAGCLPLHWPEDAPRYG